MDRLKHVKFIPFDINNNIALSDNNANLDISKNYLCEYYLPTDSKDKISKANLSYNFSMIHLNIRSIINKVDLLNNYSLNKSFHIIRLNETNFELPNYDFVNVNRSVKVEEE